MGQRYTKSIWQMLGRRTSQLVGRASTRVLLAGARTMLHKLHNEGHRSPLMG